MVRYKFYHRWCWLLYFFCSKKNGPDISKFSPCKRCVKFPKAFLKNVTQRWRSGGEKFFFQNSQIKPWGWVGKFAKVVFKNTNSLLEHPSLEAEDFKVFFLPEKNAIAWGIGDFLFFRKQLPKLQPKQLYRW